eukprot:UN25320
MFGWTHKLYFKISFGCALQRHRIMCVRRSYNSPSCEPYPGVYTPLSCWIQCYTRKKIFVFYHFLRLPTIFSAWCVVIIIFVVGKNYS